jgi:hypothetical protein
MGIRIDPEVYADNEKLKFASTDFYETDLAVSETVISWMRNIGCSNVVLGRGIRSVPWKQEITDIVEKYGMKVHGPLSYGTNTGPGITMLLQQVSSNDKTVPDSISKTIVIKDSRPIEVK